jgi:hypothetical protein
VRQPYILLSGQKIKITAIAINVSETVYLMSETAINVSEITIDVQFTGV